MSKKSHDNLVSHSPSHLPKNEIAPLRDCDQSEFLKHVSKMLLILFPVLAAAQRLVIPPAVVGIMKAVDHQSVYGPPG